MKERYCEELIISLSLSLFGPFFIDKLSLATDKEEVFRL